MTIMVPIALFGWIPVILLLFANLPSRRAAIVAILYGWMFLPSAGYNIPGLPDYSKVTATSLGVLIATVLFDPDRLASLRPRLLDLPMLAWCLCPFASSITNGLGPYDGASTSFGHLVQWGLPYVLGRAYLRRLDDFRELAYLLFIGGLVYVPICLFEIRMSPQLNRWVYGFGGGSVEYAATLGKWGSRPAGFIGTRLTLAMFMTAATLAGMWLWSTGGLKRLWGWSAGWLLGLLFVTTLLCKNVGGITLLLVGLLALASLKYMRTRAVVLVLLLAAPTYMFVRSTGRWGGEIMVSAARSIHEMRASSIDFRLRNEDILVAKALQRPFFGWGGWGRARVYDEHGRDISITDGMWIIALGNTGLFGLIAFTSAFLLPALVIALRLPAAYWVRGRSPPVAALVVLIILYMIDCLFNAMLNPIYVFAAGGLAVVATMRWRMARQKVRVRPQRRAAPPRYSMEPERGPAAPPLA